MITLQCALCGKKQKIEELYKENIDLNKINTSTFSARRTPDRIHYRFVKCLNCGLIFSNPIFPLEKISNLYKKSTFDYETESSYLKKTYGYYLQKALKNLKRRDLRLLDIGCGNGFFLEEARNMGIGFVHGIEPGRESVNKAPAWLKKKIKVQLFEKEAFKNDIFDIVCCFHTLDHIVDPNEFLKNVHAVLKKRGGALFIVHDTNGLSVRLFGEKSPIFDIEHIYLFNKTNLTNLFLKNEFSDIEIFEIKNTYPLKYWVRMIPLPKKIKELIFILLKKINLADISVSLSAGNIGIFAQK